VIKSLIIGPAEVENKTTSHGVIIGEDGGLEVPNSMVRTIWARCLSRAVLRQANDLCAQQLSRFRHYLGHRRPCSSLHHKLAPSKCSRAHCPFSGSINLLTAGRVEQIQSEEAVVAIMIGEVSMKRHDGVGIVGTQATQRYKAPVRNRDVVANSTA